MRKTQTKEEAAVALSQAAVQERRAGRLEEAERLLLRVAQMLPQHAAPLINLGNHYRYAGALAKAETAYLKALRFSPGDANAKTGLGNTYLAQGRYELGWPLMEARNERRVSRAHQHSFPEWRGEPLQGRSIVVWWEQGLGDQIQCYRVVRQLKQRGAGRVSVVCSPSLAALFSTNGADAVIPLVDPVSVPRHDLWALQFSALGYLNPTLADVNGAPYLEVTPSRGGGVGLVWRGNPRHVNDANRSLQAPPELPGQDLSGLSGDFLSTAKLVAGLDLLITVDTSMAHLAGALGVPCWVLLPKLGLDWRWVQGREDSPWYASMRLFHQQRAGDWGGVVERVRSELERGAYAVEHKGARHVGSALG